MISYPSLIQPSEYSRSQTADLRTAMARALQRYLQDLRAETGVPVFQQVFDAWPDPESPYIAPCTATVLPGAVVYESAGMTPALLDETWEPKGQPGLALYKTAEVMAEFEIAIRCPTPEERVQAMAAIEDSWIAPGVLMAPEGARYGILLDMPDYWGLSLLASIKSSRISDDSDSALREHREGTISISAQAAVVKLGPVQPMAITIRQTVLSADDVE